MDRLLTGMKQKYTIAFISTDTQLLISWLINIMKCHDDQTLCNTLYY